MISKNKNLLISIGIDPGLNTGVAVWDRINKRFIEIRTTDFFGAISDIKRHISNWGLLNVNVYIEAPQLISTTFDKRIKGKSQPQKLKISQNVGMNKKESMLLDKFCQNKNIAHFMIKPTSKTSGKSLLKNAPVGMTQKAYFNKITGWDCQSSEHSRDAAMLVYGL